MAKSCFWAINRSGQIYYLSLNEMEWILLEPNVSKQSFKKISAQEHCAWGIGADQRVYMCVFPSDIPIRMQVSTYENQRLSVRRNWSDKSMIFTDRPAWSCVHGLKSTPRESFELTPYWKWEGEWYKDLSIACDEAGWQYAIDFPRKFYKSQGKLSFVRRRKWSRYKCFDSFGKWIRIHWEGGRKDPFQDITIGGSLLPRQSPGYLAVWALTFCGKLLYREGVTWNSPEGTDWIQMDHCEELNFTQVSVGPSGLLWVLQWDGIALARLGISHQNPMGTHWQKIDIPAKVPPTFQFMHVSVGMGAVWALGNNGKVFYRKGIDGTQAYTIDSNAHGAGWVEMVGSFQLLSVGPNNQVWAVDKAGSLVIRTDVTQYEPVGKEWKLLKSSPGLSEVDVRVPSEGLYHWIWINSGGCNVDSTFFTSLGSSLKSVRSSCSSLNSLKFRTKQPWRRKILDALKQRNESVIERYKTFDGANQQEGSTLWSKVSKCYMLSDKALNIWCECHVKFQTEEDSNDNLLLFYYSHGDHFKEVRVPLKEISCVNLTVIPSHPNTFVVNTLERTFRRNPLIVSMDSETEVREWIALISSEAAKIRLSHCLRKPTKDSVWVTSVSGDVFFCPRVSSEGFALDKMFWMQVGGHMKKVTAGVDGIAWGIGFDGRAYAYSGGEGGGIFIGQNFDQEEIYEQEDLEEVFIYENQRWNPYEGFSDRLLPSDRYSWSNETGTYHCPKSGYRLPSSQWRWQGDWEYVYEMGDTDDDGWQYAVDFPAKYRSSKGIHDFVRRRKWKRKCKLKTTGPWLLVESDAKLVDVAIQTDPGDTVAHCYAVWAVSTNGDVYYRDSVDTTHPTGRSWKHIPTTVKFISISIGSNKTVWGIAEDGSAYLRGGFGTDAQIGSQWFRCGGNEIPLRQVSVGTEAVLALDSEGKLWRRDEITPTFPEGTEWINVFEGFAHVSVGFRNDTWIVRNNDVEICTGKDINNPIGSGAICVLSGDWSTICIRGCSPEVVEADECTESLESPKIKVPEASLFKKDIFDNEISIFDVYGKQHEESDDNVSEDFISDEEL